MSPWAGEDGRENAVIVQAGAHMQFQHAPPLTYLLRVEHDNKRAGIRAGDYVLVCVQVDRSRDTLGSGALVLPMNSSGQRVKRVDQLGPTTRVWGVVVAVLRATQTFPELA